MRITTAETLKRIKAKRELYSILLKKENKTDAEINIAYELSKDDEIQDFLQRWGGNERMG